MERLLVIGCAKTMDKVCIGCSRCLVAFNSLEGEFTRYREGEAQLIGITSCGDCPGQTLVPRLALMKLENSPLGQEQEPTKIHLAPCLVNCPHSESMVTKIEAKCGIEIIKGTHPYQVQRIFD